MYLKYFIAYLHFVGALKTKVMRKKMRGIESFKIIGAQQAKLTNENLQLLD